MPTVAFCRSEQLRCAAEIANGNTLPGGPCLGLFDWFSEEFLMNEKRRIIGLSGKMGAGKDAVAALLSMLGYQRFGFADALREEVVEAIEARISTPSCLTQDAADALAFAPVSEVYDKPTTPGMRALLQQWGTEYRRSQRESYWVDIMRAKLAGVPLVVISDVRFADEAALVREIGGRVWRIERPGAGGNTGHVSEAMPFEPDYVIHNTGTLEDLAREVRRALAIQGAQ